MTYKIFDSLIDRKKSTRILFLAFCGLLMYVIRIRTSKPSQLLVRKWTSHNEPGENAWIGHISFLFMRIFETDIKMSIYLNMIVCHSGSQINIWKSLSRIVSLLVSLVNRSLRSIV